MTGPLTADGLRLLEGQLGRMRGMLYRYYELFYRFIGVGLVAVGLLFIGAFWPPTQAGALLLPFVTIYVGFHAASLFSYVVFARTYAAAIERRINREVGADVLVAHRLEAAYFGAPGDPKLVAASLRRPLTMLSAETWHFTVAGAGVFAVGTMIANNTVQQLGPPWSTWYLPVVLGWAALNGAYLVWHFVGRRDQRALEAILADAYDAPPGAEPA